jgi:hypothetical protein
MKWESWEYALIITALKINEGSMEEIRTLGNPATMQGAYRDLSAGCFCPVPSAM